jgi:hypothetical protein
MDFSLTIEQQLKVDAAKRMVESYVQPFLDANDRDRNLPKAAVLKIMEKAAGHESRRPVAVQGSENDPQQTLALRL